MDDERPVEIAGHSQYEELMTSQSNEDILPSTSSISRQDEADGFILSRMRQSLRERVQGPMAGIDVVSSAAGGIQVPTNAASRRDALRSIKKMEK